MKDYWELIPWAAILMTLAMFFRCIGWIAEMFIQGDLLVGIPCAGVYLYICASIGQIVAQDVVRKT